MNADELKNIVRNSFEESAPETAPQDLWNNISSELSQHNIDHSVKESFEGANQADTAPEFVWDKVQDQLDIDRVWNNIAGKLYLRKRFRVFRFASLLLLLLLPLYLDQDLKIDYVPFKDGSKSHITLSYENSEQSIKGATKSKMTTSGLSKTTNPRIVNQIASNTVHNSGDPIETKQSTKNGSVQEQFHTHKRDPLTEKDPRNREPLFTPMAYRNLNEPKGTLLPVRNYRKKSSRLMLGAISGIDNTWIIDNTTRSGFDNSSLVQNDISFGGYYGVFAEWKLKPRFALTGEYIFQARSRQNLDFFNQEGLYVHQYQEINTQRAALLSTFYTQPKFIGVSHSNVFKFGICYSNVKNNVTTVNDMVVNKNSIVNRHDFGFQGEIGKRFYLRSFVIGAGISGHLGLLNMAPANGPVPASLNFTRIASGGVYLRVGYAL